MNDEANKIIKRLEKHASPTPCKWREVFEYMNANDCLLYTSPSPRD